MDVETSYLLSAITKFTRFSKADNKNTFSNSKVNVSSLWRHATNITIFFRQCHCYHS